jgi:hypothetical protein
MNIPPKQFTRIPAGLGISDREAVKKHIHYGTFFEREPLSPKANKEMEDIYKVYTPNPEDRKGLHRVIRAQIYHLQVEIGERSHMPKDLERVFRNI